MSSSFHETVGVLVGFTERLAKGDLLLGRAGDGWGKKKQRCSSQAAYLPERSSSNVLGRRWRCQRRALLLKADSDPPVGCHGLCASFVGYCKRATGQRQHPRSRPFYVEPSLGATPLESRSEMAREGRADGSSRMQYDSPERDGF